jgi:hypothetical protein
MKIIFEDDSTDWVAIIVEELDNLQCNECENPIEVGEIASVSEEDDYECWCYECDQKAASLNTISERLVDGIRRYERLEKLKWIARSTT